ncbi:tetrathionate reductase subunit A [Salmonella enterica subsp. enterica serovar Heidelberg str. N4496]|nr:tetrathionate reductase subunit A [Salmonella enterica subsp. enterica serovar Heidelberg str. N4496]
MGATQHSLDGVPMPYDPQIRAGINLNDLGFADPTRTITNTWLDWVSGAAVRQGAAGKNRAYITPGPESDIVLFRRG